MTHSGSGQFGIPFTCPVAEKETLNRSDMDKLSYFSNAHTAYLDELYNAYKQNPESVDITWQKFFEGFEFSQQYTAGSNGKAAPNGTSNGTATAPVAPATGQPGVDIDKEIQVRN